jgi:hypothetical protein
VLCDAASLEHHHRLRGGAPEEAIRQLKEDFGLCHAPLENFFGNWCWWLASALSYNIARWVRVLAPPEAFRTCRGKRLRLYFSTSRRVSREARGAFTSAFLVPMGTRTPSSPRSSDYGRFPPSPENS